ncbi:MAG TPA: hypothetical protein V6C97_36910 [Oculatellaceae cyanobacterium]
MFLGNKSRLNRQTGTGTTRLGEILVEAGVIKNELITQSLAIAKNSKLPIGRVLTMYGFTSEKVIESALAAQQGLREGRFNRQQASQLVRVAYTSQVSFEQAQSIVGLTQADAGGHGELGRMLLASGILTEETLNEGKTAIEQTDKTLGQLLLEQEKIPIHVLINALHLSLLCRDQALPQLDAVSILDKVHRENMSIPEAVELLQLGNLPEQKDIHLAAFLILAQFVDQRIVLQTLEQSLDRKVFFGDILVERKALTPESLDAAIHLQEMVEHQILELDQACDIFSFVAELNAPLDGLLVEFEKMSEIAKFIIAAKVIPESDCEKFNLREDNNDILMGISLLRSGLVSEAQVGYASNLVDQMKSDNLNRDDALGIYLYCLKNKIEPESAVKQFQNGELKELPKPSNDNAIGQQKEKEVETANESETQAGGDSNSAKASAEVDEKEAEEKAESGKSEDNEDSNVSKPEGKETEDGKQGDANE